MNEEWLQFTEEEFVLLVSNFDVSSGNQLEGKLVAWIDEENFRILIYESDVVY